MGDARDTAKKKKADEKKKSSKPARRLLPRRRPPPRRSRPRSNGVASSNGLARPGPGTSRALSGAPSALGSGHSFRAERIRCAVRSPIGTNSRHLATTIQLRVQRRGSAAVPKPLLGGLEAARRQFDGERMRGDGVLLVRELTGQRQRRPR